MKGKRKRTLKRILCCALAVVTLSTTTSVSEIVSSAIYVNSFSTYQAYPGHGGDTIQTIASKQASSGKYGWQNTLSMLGAMGTLKSDGTGYSSLIVPTSANKASASVNSNGEAASDRIANAWSNGYSFYMSPPSDSEDYEYVVTRNGVDYTFNKSNNWGWDYLESGKAFASSESIFNTPNTFSTTELLAGDSTISANRTAAGIAPYSTANHRWLTYDELFSGDSGLVKRENGGFWSQSSGVPSTLIAKGISTALGLKYIGVGYSTEIDKPYEDNGGSNNWRVANRNLAWIYKNYNDKIKGKTLEEIANDEQYYDTRSFSITFGEEKLTLGEVALETIKTMKHSGWGFALQESDKGTLSCTYKNVGKWFDSSNNTWHNVDVKLTVMDYQGNDIFNYRQARYSSNGTAADKNGKYIYTNLATADFYDSDYTRTYGGGLNVGNEYTSAHPKFSFTADKIGIDAMDSCYVKCNYSFTDSDTGKSINVCGNSVWKDIDGAQSVSFKMANGTSNGVTGVYDYNKKFNLSTAISGYTGASSLSRGTHDTLSYKTWIYRSNKGNETYLGTYDWLSSSSSDNFLSNWVYAEFKGSFDVVYGLMGHRDIENTGVSANYISYAGDVRISPKSGVTTPSTSYSSNSFNYYDKSANKSETITLPAVHAMTIANGHIASEVPEGEQRGNLTITKKIRNASGKITSPTSTDISNIYFAIKDSAGNYLTYDPGSSSGGEYVASDMRVSNYRSKKTAKFKLAADGSLEIYGLQAGAYFIEEKTIDITSRNEYSTTTVISSDGKTIYDDTNPVIIKEDVTSSVVVTNSKEVGSLKFTKFMGNLGVLSSNTALLNGLEFKIAVDTSKTEHLSEYSMYDYYVCASQKGSGAYTYESLGSPVGVTAVNQSTVFKLGADSSFSVSDLPVGTYYITEVTGNSLFKSLMNDVKFTVQSKKTASAYGINETKKGSVVISKTNNDGSAVADGIKFTLSGTSSYGTTVNVAGTIKNGKVTFSNIPIGTYKLSEDASTVPSGYSAASDKTVTISSDRQTVNVNVVNTALTGKITYYKYVEKSAGSNDYSSANSSLDNGIWQDSNTVYFNLRNNDGKYIIATGNAANGYKYSDVTTRASEATRFTLNSDGKFTVDGLPLTDTYAVSEVLGSSVSSIYDTPYSTTPTSGNRHDPLGTTYYSPSANGNAVILIYNPIREAGTLNFTKYVRIGSETSVIDNEDAINELEFMVYGVNPSSGQPCYIGASGSDGEYTFATYGAPVSSGIQAGTVFKLSASGTFKITGLDEGLYTVIETKTSEKYFTGTMEDVQGEVTSEQSLDLAGYNVLKTGSVTVHKTFEGQVIEADASFTLTGKSDYGTDVNIGPITVIDGNAAFSNVPFGTYTLSESYTPDNYDKAEDQIITVNSTEKPTVVNIDNPATRGQLTIDKINEDGSDPIDGIRFLIKSVSTDTGVKVEDKVVSIVDGSVDVDSLPYGTYMVEEIESSIPDGYVSNTEKQTITINSDSPSASVTFYNAPTMSIVINKSNDDGASPKDGIQFNIQCVRPLYTDAPDDITVSIKNGQAKVDNLPSGWYIVTELPESIPDGYVKNAQTVVLTDIEGTAGEVVTAEFENMAIGNLVINKSNDDGSSADGITFSLSGTADNGIPISQTATIVDGRASIDDIPLGTYMLSENKSTVPDGYEAAPDRTIRISKAGEVVSVDVVNKAVRGPITITKALTTPYYTDEDFIFEVTQTDEDTGESYSFLAYIIVPAGKMKASVTIDNCYVGKTYTVREIQSNWRYTPVPDKTNLTVNEKGVASLDVDMNERIRYEYDANENSMSFRLISPKVNKFNATFTNRGHDYWLDDGDIVKNVMREIK